MLARGFSKRTIAFDDVFGGAVDFPVDAMGMYGSGGRRTHAGVRVDQANAIEVVAIWACVSLIADAIASLPIDVFVPTGDGRQQVPAPAWLKRPNVEQTSYDFWHRVMVSLLLDGNAFIALTGPGDQPDEAWVLNPLNVTIDRAPNNTADYRKGDLLYKTGGPAGQVLTRRDVLHIAGFTRPGDPRGVSPVHAARQSIGLSKVTEEFAARFFSNGGTVGGVLETDQVLDDTKVRQLADRFEKKHTGVRRAHRPLILSNGLKYVRTQVPPNEAQNLETRQRQVEEVARLYRMPLSLIGEITKNASAGGGKGMATLDLGFVKYTLRSWIVRVEQAVTDRLPGEQYMRMNVSAFLRASDAERWAVHSVRRNIGAGTINRILALEDEPLLDDPRADDPFAPLNSSHSGTETGLGGDPTAGDTTAP